MYTSDANQATDAFNYVPGTDDAVKFGALVEQYKAYMATLSDSSNARRTFHTVFISINSLLFFAVGIAGGNGDSLLPFDRNMLLFINAIGFLMSAAWFLIVLRYRVRSAESLCLLSEVENILPLRLLQAEFDRMNDRFSPFVQRLLTVEMWIPWVFALVHVVIAIGMLTGFFNIGVAATLPSLNV